MVKTVVVTRFLKNDRYIIHPTINTKDSGSVAKEPYIEGYDLSIENLLEKILNALQFSSEGQRPNVDRKIQQKEYYKGMGGKNMKELHDNSLSLTVDLKDNELRFLPWINKGTKEGFTGSKEIQDVKVPFDVSKEELVKALELALSRCK